MAPLTLLLDPGVQKELDITAEKAESVSSAISEFQTQRHTLANQSPSGIRSENVELTALLRDLENFVSEFITEKQMTRLRQIARQSQLPFTFKTSEVISALSLTRQQISDISKIIEETRPGRSSFSIGPGDLPRFFDDHHRLIDGRPPHRLEFDNNGPFQNGPPDRPPGGRGDGTSNQFNRRPPRSMARSSVTQNTVKLIREILSPSQRLQWDELLGEPFNR